MSTMTVCVSSAESRAGHIALVEIEIQMMPQKLGKEAWGRWSALGHRFGALVLPVAWLVVEL
jgi:hypothetical protein